MDLLNVKQVIDLQTMNDFESYKNAIDVDYDSKDVTFFGYVYKLNKLQFNVIKRCVYSKSTKYMQQIVEYHDKTVRYQLLECVLSNGLNILVKKIIQKNF